MEGAATPRATPRGSHGVTGLLSAAGSCTHTPMGPGQLGPLGHADPAPPSLGAPPRVRAGGEAQVPRTCPCRAGARGLPVPPGSRPQCPSQVPSMGGAWAAPPVPAAGRSAPSPEASRAAAGSQLGTVGRLRGPLAGTGQLALPAPPPLGLPAQAPHAPASAPPPERVCDADADAEAEADARCRGCGGRGGAGARGRGRGGSEITSRPPAPPRRAPAQRCSRARWRSPG